MIHQEFGEQRRSYITVLDPSHPLSFALYGKAQLVEDYETISHPSYNMESPHRKSKLVSHQFVILIAISCSYLNLNTQILSSIRLLKSFL